MRIRKNSKLITPSSSSFLICQLNRSPWDVDDHSFSLHFQDDLPQLHFSSDSGGESLELSFEYVEKKPPPSPPQSPSPSPPPIEEFDKRIDNRNGWQHIHHQLRPPPLPPIPKRRGRPKKPGPTNNSHYSGLGPRLGSKRTGGLTNTSYRGNNNTIHGNDNYVNSTAMGHIFIEDGNGNENGNGIEMVEEELDYIEDDYDYDDDDDDGYLEGRRVRKPIKARSLKSLM